MTVRDGDKGSMVNMGETKVPVSGINLDMLKKSRKNPCGVCQSGVDCNAIFCGGCKHWVHKNCSRDPCAPTLDSGAPDVVGLLGLLMKEKI